MVIDNCRGYRNVKCSSGFYNEASNYVDIILIAEVLGMSSALPVPITRHPNMLTSQLIIYGVVWVLHAGMACNFGLGLEVVDTSFAIRNCG